MEKFSYTIFFSQIQRLSCSSVQKLVTKWQKELERISIVDANQIFRFIDHKFKVVEQWQNKDGMVDMFTFKMISSNKIPDLSPYTFEEIDNLNKLHPTIQVEIISLLDENEKMNLLNNYGAKLLPIVIQDIILTLSKNNQKLMIPKYKKQIINSDFKLFLTFIATLDKEIQRFFISTIKDSVNNMKNEEVIPIILAVYESNIKFFFKEYFDLFNSFDTESFIELLSMLTGSNVAIFCEVFKNKLNDIPADMLMYKLGIGIDNPEQLYNFWKSNPDKLAQLSDTYFNLIISRLDDTSRINSLIDFKPRYRKIDTNDLLNLFEFDSDKIKAKLFLEYTEKFNELNSKIFIDYIIEKIDEPELRNKIFLLYKNKLCTLGDEEFIYFINQYSEVNLKYSYYYEEKEKNKDELSQFIISNFANRLQSIDISNLPTLFSESDSSLQNKYVILLKDSLDKLILDKKYIEELLRKVWGSSKELILKSFTDSLKTLNGEDWYKLLTTLKDNDLLIIEDLLLNCEIDNLDFVNKELLLNNAKVRKMFGYFQQNIQVKLYDTYSQLYKNGNTLELLNKYEELMTKIIDGDYDNVLTDYNCSVLLILLRVLLSNNVINDQDDYYQMFKEYFMNKLLNNLAQENPDNVNKIKDSVFYRLVKGSITPVSLVPISSLKGLIFFNKNIVKLKTDDINVFEPDEIEPFVQNMSEEQVIIINNKLLKQISVKLMNVSEYDSPSRSSIRNLALKLYLSLGFQNAKRILDFNVDFTTYEYIFNGINTLKIKLNENGEPIINKKLNDFMFGGNISDPNTNINRLLNNSVPEFDKKFSQIYNGWQTIYQELNGNVTLSRILKWFQDNKVLLNPDEYRLMTYINELDSDDQVIQKARSLYADMRKREFSTIPKVSGQYNDEYTYEMLDLDDPLGLVVGYITRCCFLINGASASSLYHSAQSKDGRIFVVRKNGELIAQSWVWRNGNLLCFDNIETRGYYDYNILLETYKIASQSILKASSKDEDTKEQIKLVTFGGSYSRIAKPKERVLDKNIQTPRVESRIYTDAKYEQYILASNGDDELYYGDVEAHYKDERKKPDRYVMLSLLDREDKSNIIKKIRAIDFIQNGTIKTLDFEKYEFASIADDWYILVDNNGHVECSLIESDKRAKKELFDEIDNLDDLFLEYGIGVNSKDVKEKVLSFVKGVNK